jgi:hypothetical protein
MKSIPLLATTILCAGICGMSGIAEALPISETIPLERYTIVSDDTLQYDVGRMLTSGKFTSVTSTDMGLLDFPLSDFEPISGRPIMVEEAFTDYKAAGVIPHWVRSKADFPIGLETYVIVSVAGGLDPNPIPTIQGQPTNQIVLEGQTAVFSVEANPAAYLSYQWMFDGKAISGQTASTLSIEVEKPSQAGNYSVELSTGGKKVVSKKAGLKVVIPVSIATGPKSQTVTAGHGAVFRVAAKGTSPYTYQWYFNNSPISAATKSFYSIPNANQDDAGNYSVTVSNELSGATSASAVLSIAP